MRHPVLILTGRYGRLANRLFLTAHALAAAEELGGSVLNLVFEEYADYFVGTEQDMLCRYPQQQSLIRHPKLRNQYCKVLRWIVDLHSKRNSSLGRVKHLVLPDLREFYSLEGEEFKELASSTGYIVLNGWRFRAHSLLEKHRERVKEYFSLSERYQTSVENLHKEIRERSDIVVGVHIRQGDYRYHFGGRHFYEDSQYISLMQHINELFPQKKVLFLVCSNEQKSEEAFPDLKVRVAKGNEVEDLYSLAACDYIVGAPSTYSMWASYWGGPPLYIIEDSNCRPELSHFTVNSYPRELEERFFFSS
ncbi:MAG: alpha-1,2-fucosyltransferase [Bdellovibrionales bacterium]|nr:alpha-1,2-fucosyltransferase [Bdellovibrionales bacterium]